MNLIEDFILIGGIGLIVLLLLVIAIVFTKAKRKKKEPPIKEASTMDSTNIYGKGIITIMNELDERHLKKLYQEALKLRHSSLTETIEPEIQSKEEPIVEKNKGIEVKTALLNYMYSEGKMSKKTIYSYCTEKLGLSKKDIDSLVKQLINSGKIYDSGKSTYKSLE